MKSETQHLFKGAALGLLLFFGAIVDSRADGGWICLQQTQAPYKITVFANPSPLRAGPVDFAVLLQDLETGRSVTDAGVNLSVVPIFDIATSKDGQWLPPCCRLEANTLQGKAILGAGGNGLLYELRTSLAQPGTWKIEVSVLRNGQTVVTGGNIQIESAAAPWFIYWPYLVVPFLGMAFLGLNWMARRTRKMGPGLVAAETV